MLLLSLSQKTIYHRNSIGFPTLHTHTHTLCSCGAGRVTWDTQVSPYQILVNLLCPAVPLGCTSG